MVKIVKGKEYEMLIGTRAQVWHGTAYKTSGGLTKNDLLKTKRGRIVSKVKHESAKREKRLIKAGYGTKKGKFGFVKIGDTKKHSGKMGKSKKMGKSRKMRKSRKMKGGSGIQNPLSPSDYHFSGPGTGTTGVNLQFVAGNAV